MMKETVQDTIRFSYSTEKIVKSEDVKVTMQITALVKKETPDDELAENVQQQLSQLVDTKWSISKFTRTSDAGMERASITATARVKHANNVNLADRALRAEKEGMSFSVVDIDDSIAASKVRDMEVEARAEIYLFAQAEAKKYTDFLTNTGWGGGPYRVSSITFRDASMTSTSPRGMAYHAGPSGAHGPRGVAGASGRSLAAAVLATAVRDHQNEEDALESDEFALEPDELMTRVEKYTIIADIYLSRFAHE